MIGRSVLGVDDGVVNSLVSSLKPKVGDLYD